MHTTITEPYCTIDNSIPKTQGYNKTTPTEKSAYQKYLAPKKKQPEKQQPEKQQPEQQQPYRGTLAVKIITIDIWYHQWEKEQLGHLYHLD